MIATTGQQFISFITTDKHKHEDLKNAGIPESARLGGITFQKDKRRVRTERQTGLTDALPARFGSEEPKRHPLGWFRGVPGVYFACLRRKHTKHPEIYVFKLMANVGLSPKLCRNESD